MKWPKSQIENINDWLRPIFGQTVYKLSDASDFGFENTIGMVKTPLEGQIHTGRMMKALLKLVVSKDVVILNNVAVTGIVDQVTGVELELNKSFVMRCRKVFVCTNAFTSSLFKLDVVPARAQVLVTRPLAKIPFRGCFHFDEGYYFFRNIGDRVLFGGGRNLDIHGETTTEFGTTPQIQGRLEKYLREMILPGIHPVEIEQRWSGIMGMGSKRSPIVQALSTNVVCGVRLSGTGVAIGSLVGEELASL